MSLASPPCADKFATAKAGIEAKSNSSETLGIPSRLREVGITEESLKVMADKLNLPNGYVPCSPAKMCSTSTAPAIDQSLPKALHIAVPFFLLFSVQLPFSRRSASILRFMFNIALL